MILEGIDALVFAIIAVICVIPGAGIIHGAIIYVNVSVGKPVLLTHIIIYVVTVLLWGIDFFFVSVLVHTDHPLCFVVSLISAVVVTICAAVIQAIVSPILAGIIFYKANNDVVLYAYGVHSLISNSIFDVVLMIVLYVFGTALIVHWCRRCNKDRSVEMKMDWVDSS